MEQIAPLEVGIAVADLDRMVAFYTGVLSFTEVRRRDIPASLTGALTSSRDGYINVWMRAPGGEVIKLFRSPTTNPSDVPRVYLADRTGIAFLTFYCSDLQGVLATAEANGAVLRSDRSLFSGTVGMKLAFLDDPEGNVIELVEPVTS